MTWFGWLLIGLLAVSAVITVSSVDKPRDPILPATAALIVVVDALLIWGSIAVGTNA